MRRPDVSSVSFQVLDTPSFFGEQVRMIIQGEGPFSRAIPLQVRVGDQEARVGSVSLIDGSLDTFLMNEPAQGDVVFVGWADDDELPATAFTYERPPVG